MDPKDNIQNVLYEKLDEKYIIKDDDIEPVASGSFIKVNGDHISDQLFQNDEESCSSTNSSSSHNLVIDQPEEGNLNTVRDVDESTKKTCQKDTSLNPLKRKLSVYENDSPEHKQPHLMKKSTSKLSPKCTSNTDQKLDMETKSSNNEKKRDTLLNVGTYETVQHKEGNEDHFQEYAKYLKLKPTVKYKCFKCFNNSFETLSQLRSHQKVCLFKENHRHSSQDGNSTDTHYSSNSKSLFENICTNPTSEQFQARLEKQYIDTKTTAKAKKKVFLCAACGTYYENWNLFLHMREVHRRHICLYCVGMFPTAERLTLHLEMKHDLEQNHFESHEKLLRASRDTCYLMCCICEHIFTEHEDFQDHNCSELISPCSLCGQKGRHSTNCRSLQSDRLSKDKSRKKVKTSKDTSLEQKRSESAPIHQPSGDNVRLMDNLCDTKKTKYENQSHWNFKLNGCVAETNVNNEDNSVKLSEIIAKEKQPTIECESPKKTLNTDALNSSDALESRSVVATEMTQENVADISNLNSEILSHNSPKTMENVSPKNKFSERSKDKNINEEIQAFLQESNDDQNLHQDNFYNHSADNKASTMHDLNQSGNDSLQESVNTGIVTPPNSVEIHQKEEIKPLFVPKFKIKIPKEYQTPIESEHSSTESDEEQDPLGNTAEMSEEEYLESKEITAEINGKEAKDEIQQESETDDNVSMNKEDEGVNSDTKPAVFDDLKMEAENVSTQNEKTFVDGIEVANEDVSVIELLLDRPIDRIPMVEFLRICLRLTYPICLYCNHARRIAVNGYSLALHMIAQHRFAATVDSITAEELQPPTIVVKLKNALLELTDIFLNMETYCSTEKDKLYPYEKIFECFLCRFETRIHKELYLHNRKMHLKTAILCFMCRANFFSYSEILCHMCPGMPNKCVIFDIKFRCCLCDTDQIPSAFRLMVHLRKKHFACDVCLEDCQDQSRLSSHVWKHKLHHLCYRCGIAYRNKPDITKHLFWKHGTESVLCKRCLQKRWPHVYHFCIPPPSFVCEVCNIAFSKAMFLKVHKRLHTGDAPYPCTEDNCDKKFISRKLLLKHVAQHTEEIEVKPAEEIAQQDEMKNDTKVEETKQENSAEEETKKDDSSKKKRKKIKKVSEENIDDLMNLPAPNLSESDSSDDSDTDKVKQEILIPNLPKVMLSPPSDVGEDDKDINPAPIMEIWENFKSFQASRNKNAKEDSEDTDEVPTTPILHVTQSDHDYCMMYKPITKDCKNDKEDSLTESKVELISAKTSHNTSSPKKKQKSTRKLPKTGSDSSSSGSSSGSDSSCSCGSNCSCSSSSGSSSNSSSTSEDSDSSTSEGRRRIAAKRAAKKEKRNRTKSDNSSKANTSDLVDVVNTDTKLPVNINFNSIILETDLETDESDTDEDFYDEHPQKLATQLLAEKRKQLMMQTCLSPSHNFDIVENSRPSTPSLPEEVMKEKKVKIKKKKRDKKNSKSNPIPTLKLNIPSILGIGSTLESINADIRKENITPQVDAISQSSPISEVQNMVIPSQMQQVSQSMTSTPIPAPIAPRNRLSTGSSSDADAPLKRSKRARRPNKFYGYSSDDESMGGHITGPAAFKPTPPPNLTWRKEDLPAPSKSLTTKTNKSTSNTLKRNTPTNTPPLPPIPPIIIRPSAILQSRVPTIDNSVQKPPVVEPMRVPPVPVHHIQPPQNYPSSRESMESESSDEDRLHIPVSTQHNIQKQATPVVVTPKPTSASSLPVTTQKIPPALLPNPDFARLQYFQRNNIRWPIRPPAGARPPREGESVYCYCRCPYDEVSEMIACDGDDCLIEWFHFECVGIMVPPKGKWFCPECRPKYPHEMLESYENT